MLANYCVRIADEVIPFPVRVWSRARGLPWRALLRPRGAARTGPDHQRRPPRLVAQLNRVRVDADVPGFVVLNRNWEGSWHASRPYEAISFNGLVAAVGARKPYDPICVPPTYRRHWLRDQPSVAHRRGRLVSPRPSEPVPGDPVRPATVVHLINLISGVIQAMFFKRLVIAAAVLVGLGGNPDGFGGRSVARCRPATTTGAARRTSRPARGRGRSACRRQPPRSTSTSRCGPGDSIGSGSPGWSTSRRRSAGQAENGRSCSGSRATSRWNGAEASRSGSVRAPCPIPLSSA